MRLVLLGEKLIAFRDGSNRLGVMDHRRPHRCASLFLGRNEENGIRCVYHGWKYDAAGNCFDMPNAPPHPPNRLIDAGGPGGGRAVHCAVVPPDRGPRPRLPPQLPPTLLTAPLPAVGGDTAPSECARLLWHE
jgi:nitrite reductase/ring-hydroxylating ferredoxin subunit